MAKIRISDWSLGCGYDKARLVQKPDGSFSCGYGLTLNADARFGYVLPRGPAANSTSTASGYVAIPSHGGSILHNGVRILVTTNGTNTKVYRYESSDWALKETVNSAVAVDMLSYKDDSGNSTLVVFYGSSTAFRYSTDDGANWTASNRAGNSKYGNYGIVRSFARYGSQVDYVVNPNTLYSSTSMVNGGPPANSGTTVGDASTTGELFTSICEEPGTYVELIGKEFRLYTVNSAGLVQPVAGPYAKPVGDAGGNNVTGILDRKNFENPAIGSDGAIYYPVDGAYDLLRYFRGDMTLVGPKHQGDGNVFPLGLPVTAVAVAGDWILCATGTSKLSTIRDLSIQPVGNGPDATKFWRHSPQQGWLFKGKWDGEQITWHGAWVVGSGGYIGMWYEPSGSLLWHQTDLSIATTQSIGTIYFALSDPLRTESGGAPVLADAALIPRMDMGFLTFGDPFRQKVPGRFRCQTGGLAAGGPSMAVEITPITNYETWAVAVNNNVNGDFRESFTTIARANRGSVMPRGMSFGLANVLFEFTNTASAFGALYEFEFEATEGRMAAGIAL